MGRAASALLALTVAACGGATQPSPTQRTADVPAVTPTVAATVSAIRSVDLYRHGRIQNDRACARGPRPGAPAGRCDAGGDGHEGIVRAERRRYVRGWIEDHHRSHDAAQRSVAA